MSRETIRRAPDGARASGVFSQRLRQHVLVEREIGDEPFEPMVFLLELPESSQLAHPQVGILLLPRIERRLAHAQLPADVPDRGAALDLAQRVGHPLFGEFRALHRSPPSAVDRRSGNSTLVLTCRRSRGDVSSSLRHAYSLCTVLHGASCFQGGLSNTVQNTAV